MCKHALLFNVDISTFYLAIVTTGNKIIDLFLKSEFPDGIFPQSSTTKTPIKSSVSRNKNEPPTTRTKNTTKQLHHVQPQQMYTV